MVFLVLVVLGVLGFANGCFSDPERKPSVTCEKTERRPLEVRTLSGLYVRVLADVCVGQAQ